MNKLNILIITYYWPPSGGSGVQRWMYFAKYLKKLGCNPVVLTVDPKYASYNLKDLKEFFHHDSVIHCAHNHPFPKFLSH